MFTAIPECYPGGLGDGFNKRIGLVLELNPNNIIKLYYPYDK
jgi:hypothetical protein